MKKITLKHVKKYLEERGIAPSSKRIYDHILTTFVTDVEPGTEDWIPRATKWIRTKKLAPKTQSLHVSTARVFMNWCVERGLAKQNPMKDVRIRNTDARIKRAFTNKEVREILNTTKAERSTDGGAERSTRDAAAISLMLHTGMRVGGAVSIDIEDFKDLGDGRKTVSYLNKGHTGKDSMAVITKSLVKTLAKYLTATNRTWDDTGPFFLGPHGRISIPGMCWAVEKRFADAGFKDASAHMLRHTAATAAYLAGADLLAIRDMLGHKNVATTQGYLRSIDRTQRAAEDKIDFGEDE